MLSETEILPMVLLYARYDVDSDVRRFIETYFPGPSPGVLHIVSALFKMRALCVKPSKDRYEIG